MFASATLKAMAANRREGLHTAVLYADDEDADAILECLNTSASDSETS